MATTAFEYYQAHQEQFLEGLIRLLKVPSISTLPEHKSDVRAAATLLADELRALGLQCAEVIVEKEGQDPLVYANWLGAPGKPTLLFYGHYDALHPQGAELVRQ